MQPRVVLIILRVTKMPVTLMDVLELVRDKETGIIDAKEIDGAIFHLVSAAQDPLAKLRALVADFPARLLLEDEHRYVFHRYIEKWLLPLPGLDNPGYGDAMFRRLLDVAIIDVGRLPAAKIDWLTACIVNLRVPFLAGHPSMRCMWPLMARDVYKIINACDSAKTWAWGFITAGPDELPGLEAAYAAIEVRPATER